MRLEELEAIPYSLPFREPYVTAKGHLDERELVLVRVRGEGLEGLGETAAMSLRGGPGAREIGEEIETVCWPALQEGGLDPHRIWSAIARCRNRGAGAQALAAIDIALHDLAARAEGVPVWKLLGAANALPVVCNATIPAANPTRHRDLLEWWQAAGFRTFKLKAGLAGDVAQVAAARELLGPEAKLRLDANGAWKRDEAAVQLRALARSTIELVEEPVNGLEQMAALRPHTRIPLAADESVASVRDARLAVELDACNAATVKLAKVGGIGAALEVAAEIPVYLSSALEGPVGIAAAAHAAQALPRQTQALELAHGLATERLFGSTIGTGARAEGDQLIVADTPGLDVELDEDALAARRISP
jgi:L-alanine-DL-glutamate epimerase-like enolase superfamily enzyme